MQQKCGVWEISVLPASSFYKSIAFLKNKRLLIKKQELNKGVPLSV